MTRLRQEQARLRRAVLRRAGAVPAGRRQVRRRPGDQDHDLRDLRAEPRAAGRRHRPGLLRPGRVLRHRRLRRGAAVAAERGRRRLAWLLPAAVLLAAAVCAGGRRAVAAHQGRVLHHGHAGLRADGLLRRARHAARRRHRRHLPQRQAGARRLALDLDKPLVLYGFTWPCWWRVFGFLAVLLRSRFGRALAGIRVNEQRMRATGFSTYPYKLAAFTISGAHRRAGRLPVRGEGRLRQPRAAELAPVGRGADHDHPRRHRPPARRADRRLRLRAAAGVLPDRGDLRRLRQALAPRARA